MLTKKLKFDEDVIDVLKNMEWNENGTLGVITGGQLPRALYLNVNKAFEAMGGKWNRKLGGHVFPVDPRLNVEGLINDGEILIDRDGFFETPISVIEKMVELIPEIDSEGLFLEPSSGLGRIAKYVRDVLRIPEENIVCIEKNEDRAKYLASEFSNTINADFLSLDISNKFDFVLMNPPFEELQDVVHVMTAYKHLKSDGCLVSVMSESPFFREDKKAVEFREWLEIVNGKSIELPENSFKESGTGVNTRLVVIVNENSLKR